MILYRDSAAPAVHLHLQLGLRLMPRVRASCFQGPLPKLMSGSRNPEGGGHRRTPSADPPIRAGDEAVQICQTNIAANQCFATRTQIFQTWAELTGVAA